jgi:hypothetical protein
LLVSNSVSLAPTKIKGSAFQTGSIILRELFSAVSA